MQFFVVSALHGIVYAYRYHLACLYVSVADQCSRILYTMYVRESTRDEIYEQISPNSNARGQRKVFL